MIIQSFKGGSAISKDLENIKSKIQKARTRLTKLWELKNKTDHEVLTAAEEVDRLMNEYDKLIREKLDQKK